ncbi:MAG: hypothetical protein HGB18_00570 [Candidatus Moranbacteria bacterium]|nr:hypothetical protein [Candidatus Moranbacteria bacterium]
MTHSLVLREALPCAYRLRIVREGSSWYLVLSLPNELASDRLSASDTATGDLDVRRSFVSARSGGCSEFPEDSFSQWKIRIPDPRDPVEIRSFFRFVYGRIRAAQETSDSMGRSRSIKKMTQAMTVDAISTEGTLACNVTFSSEVRRFWKGRCVSSSYEERLIKLSLYLSESICPTYDDASELVLWPEIKTGELIRIYAPRSFARLVACGQIDHGFGIHFVSENVRNPTEVLCLFCLSVAVAEIADNRECATT